MYRGGRGNIRMRADKVRGYYFCSNINAAETFVHMVAVVSAEESQAESVAISDELLRSAGLARTLELYTPELQCRAPSGSQHENHTDSSESSILPKRRLDVSNGDSA